ncbi:hypothetical protein DPMN_180347 [Dreissena polymorpha]|uniref:ADP-ribosylation factor-like protein 2-binding protein n=1 Tax=Dreissena polymorpha TaxID=45954 RepID=A0A9D4EHY7_DREPO|nr:hypothetical protein DPMN_180347 [Dreissena polymorpha]
MASNVGEGDSNANKNDAMDTEDLGLFGDEEDLAMSNSSITDTKFDLVIGNIEDIVMEEEFQTMQHNFLEKYYNELMDTEEK